MKFRLNFSVMIVIITLSSCVSINDFEKLQLEYSSYRKESEVKIKQIEDGFIAFKNNYNPEVQETLEKNLLSAKAYYDDIHKLDIEINTIKISLDRIVAESEHGKKTVLENAATSVSQNVVNEFNTLKRRWEEILLDYSITVRNSQDFAFAAQQSAVKATEKVSSAEKLVIKASESAEKVDDMTVLLNDLSAKITSFTKEMNEIKKNYESLSMTVNRNYEVLMELYKSINTRIAEIGKKI